MVAGGRGGVGVQMRAEQGRGLTEWEAGFVKTCLSGRRLGPAWLAGSAACGCVEEERWADELLLVPDSLLLSLLLVLSLTAPAYAKSVIAMHVSIPQSLPCMHATVGFELDCHCRACCEPSCSCHACC